MWLVRLHASVFSLVDWVPWMDTPQQRGPRFARREVAVGGHCVLSHGQAWGTAWSTTATAVTYAACVPRLVASTSAGQRHGGGVRPSSGNSVRVALISMPPNAALAQGSGSFRWSRPCMTPNAEP